MAEQKKDTVVLHELDSYIIKMYREGHTVDTVAKMVAKETDKGYVQRVIYDDVMENGI